jgi:hypothetical protein
VVSRVVNMVMSRVGSRVVSRRTSETERIMRPNVINSIIRSYFTASDKATGKIRYYFGFKKYLTVIRNFALRRSRWNLRSKQGS